MQGHSEADYRLAARDFNPADSIELAAAVTDSFGHQVTLRTAPLQINYPTTGELTIVIQGAKLYPGVRATVMTVGLEDRNGGGIVSYDWEFSGQVGIERILTINGYTFTADDLARFSAGETLQINAIYEDSLGFRTPRRAEIHQGVFDNANSPTEGAVIIDGPSSFYAGATFTANVAAVRDGNGLGNLNYQWYLSRDGGQTFIPESAATTQVYTLELDPAQPFTQPPIVRMSAAQMDLVGYLFTLAADLRHEDAAPAALVITAAGATAGAPVALTPPLADPNGIRNINYRWQTGNADFSAAANVQTTAAIYNLAARDFGPREYLRLIINYEDDFGAQYALTSNILKINEPDLGVLSIIIPGGVLQENSAAVAFTTDVFDINGGGFTEFNWALAHGAQTLVLGTTAAQTLSAPQLALLSPGGGTLRLTGIFEDSLGFGQAYVATRTGNNLGIGDLPTQGEVTIEGPASFAAGAAYTADISALQDLNGLGVFTYQWQARVTNQGLWTDLPAATAQIYSLALADFAATEINQTPGLRVAVTHMDLQGNIITKTADREHVDQAGNGYVVINNAQPRPGQPVTVLFPPTDPDGIKAITYEWQVGLGAQFTTAPVARTAEYLLRAADFNPDTSTRLRAEITDNFNQRVTLTSNIVQIAARVRGAFSLTVLNNRIAQAATVAAVIDEVTDPNGGQLVEFYWRLGGTLLAQTPRPVTGAPTLILTSDQVKTFDRGTPLRVVARHEDEFGFAATLSASLIARPEQLNRPTEGAVSIRGPATFSPAARYFADTGALTDENGRGTFTYQWYRTLDGQSFGDLAGSTEQFIDLPLTAFIGSTAPELAVEVVHTDQAGFAQTLFSVRPQEDQPATGLTIRGNGIQVGSILSVAAAPVDPNGPVVVTYQWELGSNNFAARQLLSGETAQEYTIKLNQFAPRDSARVIAVSEDLFGGRTTLTSNILMVNVPTNAPFWLKFSESVVDAGTEVIAVTTAVIDENGGQFVDFAWSLDEVPLTEQSAVYQLQATDAQRLLRGSAIHVTGVYADDLGFMTTVSAALDVLQSPSQGRVRIQGAAQYRQGNQYTADISEVEDANGIGNFEYQWGYVRNEFTPITLNNQVQPNTLESAFQPLQNQTLAVYAMNAGDFAQGEKLMVMVVHRDVLGYTTPFIAALANTDSPGQGRVSLVVDSYKMDQGGATARATDVTDQNGIKEIRWHWQSGRGPNFATPIDITVGPAAQYILRPAHFNPNDHLRAIAEIVDNFNQSTRLTTQAVKINQAVQGDVMLREVFSPAPRRLTSDISRLVDANGPLEIVNNIWQSPAGELLSGDDYYTPAQDQESVNYRVIVADPAGFQTTLYSTKAGLPGLEGRAAKIIKALDLETARKFNQAIWRHLDRQARPAGQNSPPALALNGITVQAREQLSRWANLANITTAQAEVSSANGKYSFWSDAFWTETEGTFKDSTPLAYQGSHQGWLIGADLHANNIKFGLAGGEDRYDLKVDWRATGERSGRLIKKMKVLLPYVEIRPTENLYWRTNAGYGAGDLELQEGDSTARAQFDWYMFGTDLKSLIQINKEWDVKFGLSGYAAKTRTERLKAGTQVLPGIKNSFSAESVLSMETGYQFHLKNDGYIRPYFNFGWRGKYGALRDLMIFDGGVGVDFVSAIHGLAGNFHLSDQLSENSLKTSTQFNGALALKLGGQQELSWTTRYADEEVWTQRLAWDYYPDWGLNTIKSNLYLQHGTAWSVGASLGGEFPMLK